MSLTEFTGLTSFGTGLNVALTGTPTAPIQTNPFDSSNQIATVFSAVCSVNAISNTGFSLFSANASGLTNTGISSVNYFAIGF